MDTVYTESQDIQTAREYLRNNIDISEEFPALAQANALVSIARSLEQIAHVATAPQTVREVSDAQIISLIVQLDTLAHNYASLEFGLPIKDATCMACMRGIVATWLTEVKP